MNALTEPVFGMDMGPYRVAEQIDSGGYGTVYRAEGPTGPVAAKRLLPSLLKNTVEVARFRREYEIGAMISSDRVCAALDYFEEEKWGAWIVMEWLSGMPLENYRHEVFDERFVYSVATDVCLGLRAIHEAGVVHRDLKFDNIMISLDRRAKIIDLGIAIPVGSYDTGPRFTPPNMIVGNCVFMSPEQEDGERLDGRSDLFTLGVLMSKLLSAKRDFSERLFLHVRLSQIADRLCRPHRADRYFDADEVLDALWQIDSLDVH